MSHLSQGWYTPPSQNHRKTAQSEAKGEEKQIREKAGQALLILLLLSEVPRT